MEETYSYIIQKLNVVVVFPRITLCVKPQQRPADSITQKFQSRCFREPSCLRLRRSPGDDVTPTAATY